MTKKLSFSKYENELRPEFRTMINKAESTEDVKKFFVYTISDLLDRIFQGRVEVEYEDMRFNPDAELGCDVGENLMNNEEFSRAWNESDLPHIIKRFADVAVKRHKHLVKNPDKSESKIYPPYPR